MSFSTYQNLAQADRELTIRGYDNTFIFDGQCLQHQDTQQTYTAQDLAIVEYHRFIPPSDPSDRNVIFALEAKDEKKGTVILNYATDENLDLVCFIDKIKVKTSPQNN